MIVGGVGIVGFGNECRGWCVGCGGCEGVFGGFCSGIAEKGCPSRLTHNTMFG